MISPSSVMMSATLSYVVELVEIAPVPVPEGLIYTFEILLTVILAESSNVYELSLESVIVTVYVPTGKL